MKFQFTHPLWLLLLPPALAWTVWLGLKSYAQAARWRRAASLGVRLVILLCLSLAVAGFQWLHPVEGMNLFFLLDRSDSIPPAQQEAALKYAVRAAAAKKPEDRVGLIVFGSEASIELTPNAIFKPAKIQAVIGADRTDISAAIRLGAAAFPETGQKRLALISDGNENLGDALGALMAARPLGVTLDALPTGSRRAHDVSVQKLAVPSHLKQGQPFEVKIFAQSDAAQPAKVRLYRNDQFLGAQTVQLSPGKNLFSFPQQLSESGFYTYDVSLEAPDDAVPQNNRASNFAYIRGNPRVLLVSSDAAADAHLAEALRSSGVEVDVKNGEMPASLGELQSYDSIFLSNMAAGDLGRERMRMLESAVRDFGCGLVCLGGDESFAAGGYRGTPLEEVLPVNMDLSSKKVLPRGALVMVMHGMEFNNGNQVSRNMALGALDALGPDDEIGVLLWDGTDRWLVPLQRAGDKKDIGRIIAGMNQGDMQSFQTMLTMAHDALKKSTASLKHIIVFSDGDPGAASAALMQSIAADKITVSTVGYGMHMGPKNLIQMAQQGGGRFYDVRSPNELPQIFIKEAAVILKSAIFEDPFTPKLAGATELVRGIGPKEYPQLLGYVASTAKDRAEVPLVSDKGDPILAHWQYGLGRVVAFTSDARAKWARHWLSWGRYRQFWTQIAQWSLRRVENADLSADFSFDTGEGRIVVDALDAQGNFRNFLNLRAVVVDPKGKSFTTPLEQTGPGHYEAKAPMKDVGVHVARIMEMRDGKVQAATTVGASLNYSPEFAASEANLALLKKLAEVGGGKVLNPQNPGLNPFLHDRVKTYRPQDWWQWLLELAVVLFPLDVGLRRIQLDWAEWERATAGLRRWLFFWIKPAALAPEESLGALLAKRREARESAAGPAKAELFQPQKEPSPAAFETASADSARATLTAPSAAAAPAKPAVASTASRLLDAKRRAQRKKF